MKLGLRKDTWRKDELDNGDGSEKSHRGKEQENFFVFNLGWVSPENPWPLAYL